MPSLLIRCSLAFTAIMMLVICIGSAAAQDSAAQRQNPQSQNLPSLSNDDLSIKPPAPPETTEIVIKSRRRAPAGFPAGWMTYTPEECGLSIVLPGRPKPGEIAVPKAPSPLIISERYYSYHNAHVAIVAFHLVTTSESPIKKVAQAFFQGPFGAKLQGFEYSIDPGTASRVPIRATYSEDGKPYGLEGFIQEEGKHAWAVVGLYGVNNTAALQTARKVLASASFGNLPCEDQ